MLQRVDAEDHVYLASVSVFVLLNIPDTNAVTRERVLYVLRLVGPLKTYVSSAREPYEREYILQKTPT